MVDTETITIIKAFRPSYFSDTKEEEDGGVDREQRIRLYIWRAAVGLPLFLEHSNKSKTR